MDIAGWLFGQFVMWIGPGLLLVFGVAWFMELIDGNQKPLTPKELKRTKDINHLRQSMIDKYYDERYDNPLTVEAPFTGLMESHEEWLENRVSRLEFHFNNFSSLGMEKVLKEEKIFKTSEVYVAICKHIKKAPSQKLLLAWEEFDTPKPQSKTYPFQSKEFRQKMADRQFKQIMEEGLEQEQGQEEDEIY